MDFLNDINNKTLIICNNNIKNKILKYISNLDKLINIKIINKKDFLENYYFKYNEETIYYLRNKYNINIKLAKIYLDNLIYVVDSNINNNKVKFLKEIYNDLKSNNLLKFNKLFDNYLKQINIIYINDFKIELFYKNILDKYNTKYIKLKSNKYNISNIYHFKNIEDECSFVFDEISKLIKNKVSYSNIKLVILGNEYNNIIKRFSYLYKININNLDNSSIISTITCNKILDMIYSMNKEEVFDYLINNLDNYICLSIFNILNKYYFVDNFNLVIDFIIDDLKNTYEDNIKYKNAIDIISLDYNLVNDSDYVFVLGFNLENIPRIYKNIDYLDDNIKNKLGLFTSLDMNKYEYNRCIYNLERINNLVITYKDYDPYKSYYKSNLISDMNLNEVETNSLNITSNLYNKIKLTDKLDFMLKYGVIDKELPILYSNYSDINYLNYNNKFSKIDKYHDKLFLSYTQVDSFYHCKFRYYIDYILKLNIFEDSFSIFIGNLFHFVLSKIYDDDFDLDKAYNSYLNGKSFSKKEDFYLKILKDELEKIIDVLKSQYKLTGLTKVKVEEEIKFDYGNDYFFKGIIDKIMYKEKDNNTYISLIDYKTGNPKTDMSNLIYGIDMQLPIYVYLVLKSSLFNNPKIIGFYFQKILHEKSSYDLKHDQDSLFRDKLKLNGYSIDDQYLLSIFDESYNDSMMIKGLKTSSKGFYHYSKVISDDNINSIVSIVDSKIKEAFKDIDSGIFTINPKVINGDNIGCKFCKYQDLCFKSGEDLVYLENKNTLL